MEMYVGRFERAQAIKLDDKGFTNENIELKNYDRQYNYNYNSPPIKFKQVQPVQKLKQ